MLVVDRVVSCRLVRHHVAVEDDLSGVGHRQASPSGTAGGGSGGEAGDGPGGAAGDGCPGPTGGSPPGPPGPAGGGWCGAVPDVGWATQVRRADPVLTAMS